MRVGFDTETALIAPGDQFPIATCATFDSREFGPSIATHADGTLAPAVRSLWLDGHEVVCANAAFDAGVSIRIDPTLIGAVFDAYDAGRVRDVLVRQQLIDLGEGRLRGFRYDDAGKLTKIGYALDDVAPRHGYAMPKKVRAKKGTPPDPDDWRLRYAELRDVPLAQWPPKAVSYASGDATAALVACDSQDAQAHWLENEAAQARADFALRLTSATGIGTDPAAVPHFAAAIRNRIEEIADVLCEPCAWVWDGAAWRESGLVRKDGSRNTIAAGNRMRQWCSEHGIELRQTPSGKPELSADACAEIGDPLLELYAEYSQLTKVEGNDLKFLERGTREPIHCRYNVLVETGRASSSSPNLMNLRRLPGIREAFVPPSGYVFIIADFGGLELATLAEACIALVGYSRMADALNAGRDLHLEVAARLLHITYAEAEANIKRDDVANARQTGKVANFGFPGGLAPATLVEFARALYNVIITVEEAIALKRLWLDLFPEMNAYFAIIGGIVGRGQGISQLFVGRHRGKASFTAACNTIFQGLGSDVAKSAGWDVVRECFIGHGPLRGCLPVLFCHDEWMLIAPEANASRAARALESTMVAAASRLLRHVRIDAKPVVARRYSKNAKQIVLPSGDLGVWSPSYAEAIKPDPPKKSRIGVPKQWRTFDRQHALYEHINRSIAA